MKNYLALFCLASAIAPTIAQASTLVAGDDADVDESWPAVNFGRARTMHVKSYPGYGDHSSYLHFDANAIPSGTHVARATLRVFVRAIHVPGSVTIAPASAAWNELLINAQNKPPIGAPIASLVITNDALNESISVDVTSIVRDWISGAPNYGLVIAPDGQVAIELDTKETIDTSHPAEIEVVLAGPEGPAGVAGPIGPAGPQGPRGEQGINGAQGPAGEQGPQGIAGESVIGMSLGIGDPSCPHGGSAFIVAGATTHACNGAPGSQGPAGVQGATGATGPVGPAGPAGDGVLEGLEPIGVFAGFTQQTYTGNLGGREGANAICGAAFPGAHLCHFSELRLGAPNAIPTRSNGAWIEGSARFDTQSVVIASRRFGRSEDFTNCNRWTSSMRGIFGRYVRTQPPLAGDLAEDDCDLQRQLACCSTPSQTHFAGFTEALTTGNAGGLAGMNGLCVAEFLGSHFCHEAEYKRANSAAALPAEGAWLDASTVDGFGVNSTGPDAVRLYAATDTANCAAWRAPPNLPARGNHLSRMPSNGVCTAERSVACCN